MKWWHILGAASAGAGIFYLGLKQARAATVPTRPIDGPLRPPPPDPDAPPPGPAARRIQGFLDERDDDELLALRSALPEHWFGFVSAAVQMPTDAGVVFIFGPARIDYQIMTEEERDALQQRVVAAIGPLDALELQGILEDVGVIS